MKNSIVMFLLVVLFSATGCGIAVDQGERDMSFGGAPSYEEPFEITKPSRTNWPVPPSSPEPYNTVTSDESGYVFSGARGVYGYKLDGVYRVTFEPPKGWEDFCTVTVDNFEHDLQTGDVFEDSTIIIWGCVFSVTFEEF